MRMTQILGVPGLRAAMLASTAMALTGLLAGCGQRGPLYLPVPEQATAPARAKQTPPAVDPEQLDTGANVNTPATE